MDSLWGRDGRTGIGGSELAMLTLCECWEKKGHKVRLYNNPTQQGVSEFEQLPIKSFNPDDDRDVLIIFRVPNHAALKAKGMKIFLSFDQFTSHPFMPFMTMVDKVVGISEYHSEHFRNRYDFHDMIVIDLPLRVDDFEDINVDKIPGRLIYTSVPDRGLLNIADMWPEIKKRVPHATLRITSDYRLWGSNYPGNGKYFTRFMGMDGVTFPANTALLRDDYLNELCKADILFYPHKADNPELFSISVAEAQYAGAYPVSSDIGAMATTNMGTIIPGNPETVFWRTQCVNKIVELLTDRDGLKIKQNDVVIKAFHRFHPDTVLSAWEEKVWN
jgi:glycosyltransferase involved in cell wall biosynthesis